MANAPKTSAAPKAPRAERSQDEKRANFHKAAPGRVDRVLKAVASLRSIARPGKYGWTAEEREKIFKAIADSLQGCEQNFRNPGSAKSTGFTL